MNSAPRPDGAPATAPAARGNDNWWAEVAAVFRKDLRSELRTRSAVGTILMFALTALVLIAFTVPTTGLGLTTKILPDGALQDAVRLGKPVLFTENTETRAALLASLYWVVLYFSAMTGLPRVFVKEEEMGTAALLRLTTRPSAVFTGKLLFNVVMLLVLTTLIVPLFALFYDPRVRDWPLFLGHVIVGAGAIAGAATMLGALVSRTNNRGYLMVVLGFGPLLPILILGINGTAAAISGDNGNNLAGLVSYWVMMTLVSGLLFDRVWVE